MQRKWYKNNTYTKYQEARVDIARANNDERMFARRKDSRQDGQMQRTHMLPSEFQCMDGSSWFRVDIKKVSKSYKEKKSWQAIEA